MDHMSCTVEQFTTAALQQEGCRFDSRFGHFCLQFAFSPHALPFCPQVYSNSPKTSILAVGKNAHHKWALFSLPNSTHIPQAC